MSDQPVRTVTLASRESFARQAQELGPERMAEIEVAWLMTVPEVAEHVWRLLEEQLHPFGDAGQWPEVGVQVWALYRGQVHSTEVILSPQEQEDDVWKDVPSVWLPMWEEWYFFNDPDPDVVAMRFRKRIDPVAP